jgi:hypothetical protein
VYSDPEQWARIRYRVLVEGASRRQVARETGVSRNTYVVQSGDQVVEAVGGGYDTVILCLRRLFAHRVSKERELRPSVTLVAETGDRHGKSPTASLGFESS